MKNCFKRLCCSKRHGEGVGTKDKQTYVLELGEGKYYVGESNNVKRRIWAHSNDNGSAWTKKYEVEGEMEEMKCNSNLNELVQTLEMMKEYGIDNVRGSMFTKPFQMDKSEKIMAAQLYCELHNLCRKCGSNEHFIGTCSGGTYDWVQNFGGQLERNSIESKEKRVCLECNTELSLLPLNFKYCRPCYKEMNGYQ